MQYIVGCNEIMAMALPEHRQYEDTEEGKAWNHVHTTDGIVMYNAPVDMTFLKNTILQILTESKGISEIVRHLTSINRLSDVKVHAMLLDHRDQARGRTTEGKDIWYRYYQVYHYKENDKGIFTRYINEFTNEYLYDFDVTYGIPEYMAQYLARRVYEARRTQPGDNQADHKESMDWARKFIRRECQDGMLNPLCHEISITVPEYSEIHTDKGMKPKDFKDFYQR